MREGGELVFRRSMKKEGKLGFWRWMSLFLGIAGTYRQNDSVDVVYDVDGRRVVATGLPITTHETGDEPVADAPRTKEGGRAPEPRHPHLILFVMAAALAVLAAAFVAEAAGLRSGRAQ